MAEIKSYVRTDEFGVLRVGNTRVMLEGVIQGFRGDIPQNQSDRNTPALSLEEVYGAIAYCLAHPQEVEAYLKKQQKVWEEARAEQEKNLPPVVARLRALGKKAEAS